MLILTSHPLNVTCSVCEAYNAESEISTNLWSQELGHHLGTKEVSSNRLLSWCSKDIWVPGVLRPRRGSQKSQSPGLLQDTIKFACKKERLIPLSLQKTIYIYIYMYIKEIIYIYIYFFFGLFAFSRAAPGAYGGSRARGLIQAVAAGLHHSHRNARSQPCLQPTPQLTAMPDP